MADYDVLVSTSLEERRVFARLVEEQRVDGVILVEVCLEDPRVDLLRDAGLPFVNPWAALPTPAVTRGSMSILAVDAELLSVTSSTSTIGAL